MKPFPALATALLTSALTAFSLAGAQASPQQTTQTVFINGVGLTSTVVTENGVTYYKFKADDLKRVGAVTAGGVAPKIEAIKGCVGDTLFNGVYSVQLTEWHREGSQLHATLKVSNASKAKLWNFMLFEPADGHFATKDGQAVETNNFNGQWFDTLLAGANMTVKPYTSSTDLTPTRYLIRPRASSVKDLQEAKLPLARVYNMEFDLTCQKK